MNTILKACCIILSMVVEERKHLYNGNGAGGLREFTDTDSSAVLAQYAFHGAEATPFQQIIRIVQVSDDIK